MSNKKTLKELTLKDNFMLGAVMSDENNCRRLLEMILQFPIERVEVSKENRELEVHFMGWHEMLRDEREEGKVETDLEVLKRWHKLAAKSGSMEQFVENM